MTDITNIRQPEQKIEKHGSGDRNVMNKNNPTKASNVDIDVDEDDDVDQDMNG